MIEKFLNFKDPINRKDYLIQFLKRLLIWFVIGSIFNLLDILWNSSSPINDIFWKNLLEDKNGILMFLEAVLFLPLDIRRVKDINMSINWIYFYYACSFIPFPEDNFDVGNPVSITFESSILIFWISFLIYLFIKKGSNNNK